MATGSAGPDNMPTDESKEVTKPTCQGPFPLANTLYRYSELSLPGVGIDGPGTMATPIAHGLASLGNVMIQFKPVPTPVIDQAQAIWEKHQGVMKPPAKKKVIESMAKLMYFFEAHLGLRQNLETEGVLIHAKFPLEDRTSMVKFQDCAKKSSDATPANIWVPTDDSCVHPGDTK